MRRDELPIPSPCNADWNVMEPRERGRFCASCELEVLDVSALTESEARALLRARGSGRLCVSYVVHRDGTIRLARDPATPDVPASALTRRGARMLVAASIALAACGPGSSGRLAGAPVAPVETATTEPCDRLGGAVAPLEAPPHVDAGIAPLAPRADPPATEAKPGHRTRSRVDPPDERRMLGELEL